MVKCVIVCSIPFPSFRYTKLPSVSDAPTPFQFLQKVCLAVSLALKRHQFLGTDLAGDASLALKASGAERPGFRLHPVPANIR